MRAEENLFTKEKCFTVSMLKIKKAMQDSFGKSTSIALLFCKFKVNSLDLFRYVFIIGLIVGETCASPVSIGAVPRPGKLAR